MLTVALLGPVEVRRDGVLLPVPSGKTTEVLIRLALEAGAQVRTDRLIEDLWSDQPYGVARNTLQVKVSKLRRALGIPGLISGTGTGYTLHVEPACVDALDVQHRPPADALAMFRGDVLPGAGDWAEPYRTRLADLRLRLTEDDLADRGAESIEELEALVAEHPLRERLWHLLIAALSRAGRPADALAAYDRARRLLADELGLDPSPELQDLQRRILQPPRLGNIPALSASLVGRDADVAALTKQTGRLVTVAGPAGVGKTRLAIEVARQAPAAWLVRLDGATSIWPGIGEAFGMGPSPEVMVLDRLRGLDALLVLDNCEHLVADLPDVIGRIIDAAPAVRILATSQVPLGIDGESVYELEPLSIADSMVLFTERASRQRRSFRAETADVAYVCRALDGLPLAIELAAARAKALSVPEIARRLDDRFALLQDPSGRRPARQRTLRSAIGWSYGLLFPDDQRGLWALACFTGGAPLAAAEQVLAALGVPEASAMDVIERLVDRSLAAADVDPSGAVRYRLLDSVRVFGLERLREAGQADVAAGAHAAWFAARAAEAEAGLRGPGQAVHLATVRAERANIDAALSWCAEHDPLLGLRTANGFGWGWVFLGAGSDAAQRSRASLAAAGPGAPAADRADAMLFAGWFEASGGDLERAITEVREAVRIADDKSRARLFLAFVHSQQGRPHEALAELAEFHGAGWEQGAAWLLTAWAEIALGDVAGGKQACSAALAVLTDDWALGHAEALLGALAQAEHRFADAVAHLTRATDAAGRLGFVAAGSLHRTNLGRAYQQNGDPAAAITAFERAIETAGTAGDLRIVALARTRLARVFRALGRIDEARAQVGAARRWYATGGGGDGALLADHLAAALDADEVALRRVLAAADPEITLLTLDALAYVTARDGRTAEAAALLAEAEGLFPAVAHLVTDDDRIDRRRAAAMMA